MHPHSHESCCVGGPAERSHIAPLRVVHPPALCLSRMFLCQRELLARSRVRAASPSGFARARSCDLPRRARHAVQPVASLRAWARAGRYTGGAQLQRRHLRQPQSGSPKDSRGQPYLNLRAGKTHVASRSRLRVKGSGGHVRPATVLSPAMSCGGQSGNGSSGVSPAVTESRSAACETQARYRASSPAGPQLGAARAAVLAAWTDRQPARTRRRRERHAHHASRSSRDGVAWNATPKCQQQPHR